MFDLDTHEVDKLLEKVGLDNSFLRLATADIELIRRMKQTIEHQTLVMSKRERLLFAITTNVQYLSSLHRINAKDLRRIKQEHEQLIKRNQDLEQQNLDLIEERDSLRKYKADLDKAQKEITNMIISSQANAEEINKLYAESEQKESEIEKMKLESTIIITEKSTIKKELDRINMLYNQIQKDFKEHRITFELMSDEITKVNR